MEIVLEKIADSKYFHERWECINKARELYEECDNQYVTRF